MSAATTVNVASAAIPENKTKKVSPSLIAVYVVLVVLAAFTLGVAVGVLGMVPHWWRHRSASRHQQAPAPAADTAAPLPAAAHGV